MPVSESIGTSDWRLKGAIRTEIPPFSDIFHIGRKESLGAYLICRGRGQRGALSGRCEQTRDCARGNRRRLGATH
jgi:hypothetical protein